MTDLPNLAAGRSPSLASSSTPALFAAAIFTSAGLLFLVEPIMAKLVLPWLGGSPAVWNTSLCFFQAMLLAGYAYAHGLQQFVSPRTRARIHAGVLIAAALTLPLHLSDLLGLPDPNAPIIWLLGVLTLSVGLPFAALSATAPLVQAWYARVRAGQPDGANPYKLYAASNLGSLIALLAYPTLVEPLLRLQQQTLTWSVGFVVFAALMFAVISVAGPAPPAPETAPAEAATRTTWEERLKWMALAAAPSSLMLGVTSFISTDIASAPFLWIAPLALYLVTFIIAFQGRAPVKPGSALMALAPALALCVVALPELTSYFFPLQILLHLAGFFLTALACHVALASRRPEPARLTQFYLLMSLGGVIGGVFNALIAPAVFSTIAEYPFVLALVCLTYALGDGPLTQGRSITLALGAVAALLCLAPARAFDFGLEAKLGLAAVIGAAFVLRQRSAIFFVLIGAIAIVGMFAAPHDTIVSSQRSFFGVLRIRQTALVRTLAHGTTLHGAQALAEADRCKPLVYYAAPTPIGQAFAAIQARQKPLSIGAVGMGAGTVAAYTRPGDTLRFYEIDPLVVRAATNPALFSYIKGCARGAVDTVLGDARLNLAREPNVRFDVLLVDAFSSDSIPVHLLTVEAMKLYLDRLNSDGIIVMHLSNRHLELIGPVSQVARAAGGDVLVQRYIARAPESVLDSNEEALVVARTPGALEALRADPRWSAPTASRAPVWSDDYVNLFGALISAIGKHSTAAARN